MSKIKKNKKSFKSAQSQYNKSLSSIGKSQGKARGTMSKVMDKIGKKKK